ncbi:MAG: hypothetical protein HY329_18595 [Chloroflexi bacterium]|nr:hypothetical protein [Chloroflexota bacterium]
MLSKLGRDTIVVAAHTDIIASDVDYWRVQGQSAVLERRHVPTLRAGGVDVFCDHIGGDSRYGYLPATHIRTTPLQRAMRNLDHAYHEAEESESIVLFLPHGIVPELRRLTRRWRPGREDA